MENYQGKLSHDDRDRIRYACLACICALTLLSRQAAAYELGGGVGVGAMLVGTAPHLAVSPHAGISWRLEGPARLTIRDLLSILPATNEDGAGVYNRTSLAVGLASRNVDFSAGPSLSVYSMPACGTVLCGRVVGLSPGGYAQLSLYLAGPFGLSASAAIDWIGGNSLVLPGGVAVMVFAGPVFRWAPR